MSFNLKKYVPRKIRKPIKKAAKSYLKYRRSATVKSFMKGGVPSTTAIAKQIANLRRKVATSSEYKFLDQTHVVGNPDVSLREYYDIRASANQATVSTTSTPGTSGYLLIPVTPPTRGDGGGNFDGKRYSVESIQWKGGLYTAGHSTVKLMLVEYNDEDMDPFQMNEFLRIDNNSEYSTMSKRNPDFKNYKVVASRTYRMSVGSNSRLDFNIISRPKRQVKIFEGDDTITSHRYFCVAVVSPDNASIVSSVTYTGNTRMRFIS